MKQNIYDNPVFFKKYIALRDSGITYNDFVEQPAIKSLISDLTNKSVLDLGCGTGHFSTYCIENGASRVLGVDISKNMIDEATKRNRHQRIEYICSPIEDISLANQTFDVIVSSLAIHYVENYTKLMKKINSALNENGQFIFSTEHPLTTSRKGMNNWILDENGEKMHWALDNYQEEGRRDHTWYVDGVVVYHRTISTLINTLIESGFVLEQVIEPEATVKGLPKLPKLINERRRPSFIIIKAKKQSQHNE
ncbi:class I SAM-dependent methyltransferase [Oceanobacillus polygoni]|uniref:2-polyprenyl-3-methyl-5-hydroxy-6-metoxy-1, 4-benzoquinol methylase n=1 Tax=Oceanobacillus polygoni TaxID=1235259 RepID=A0A9X1CI24_9BACI|nr:class I SAM-dependent methyltransferase [Oceanobacillus polygoni]MBP2078253.1 2-polyprenyl-3-methyl-5-hydroxy-6-metoxy-1,4-benzoquinol methylase [Oceanobacillus polygoni]